MSLTQAEFNTLLADTSKLIVGDIAWSEDEDHSPALEFRAEIQTAAGYPLFVRGSYNALIGTLTFALVLKTVGRVYALDMGKDHHNPTCEYVGDPHKHRWNDRFKDREAYRPGDIPAPATKPLSVWEAFCKEANITHKGKMLPPPALQGKLWP